MIQQVAQKLLDNGVYIIPLLPNAKKNHDTEILTKDYKVSDLIPNGNLGINLKKSGWYCLDLDSANAIHFGSLWLPRNTRIHGRINQKKKELTHWFFKSDNSIEKNESLKDSSGETIAELFVDHNIVIYGTTINKQSKLPMKRFWESESQLAPFNESISTIYKNICFASVIAPHIKSVNTGALKLDACLMRYTNKTDEQRERFLLDLYKKVMPDDKEVTPQKMRRHIRSNNRKKINAGYTSFAQYINVDPIIVKEWFGWIGNVPTDPKYQRVKSYKDFLSTDIDMKALMTKDIPEMQYSVSPILPEGVVVWAGRPKGMKSWTALKCCYTVQNGMDFLGHKTTKGDCLYLALEDSERRLKDRVHKLGLEKSKEHPYTNTEAPYLGYGLEESLKDWIDEVKNPRLIIIDTLAKVKERVGFKSGTTYDQDNELLRDLQKLAISNGITIVLISHLGKAEQDYSYDRIQGSVGMQGISDAFWLIDRGDTSPSASIKGRGRDILDFEYAVTWDAMSWSYKFEGQLSDINANENRAEIIKAMKELAKAEKAEVFPRDVINYYSFSHNSKDARRIQKTMLRMREAVDIVNGKKYGTYKLLDESPSVPEPRNSKPVASSSEQGSVNIDFEADAKLTAEKYASGEFKRTKRQPID